MEVIPAGVSAGRYGGIGRQSEKGIIDADGVILVNVSFFVGNADCFNRQCVFQLWITVCAGATDFGIVGAGFRQEGIRGKGTCSQRNVPGLNGNRVRLSAFQRDSGKEKHTRVFGCCRTKFPAGRAEIAV